MPSYAHCPDFHAELVIPDTSAGPRTTRPKCAARIAAWSGPANSHPQAGGIDDDDGQPLAKTADLSARIVGPSQVSDHECRFCCEVLDPNMTDLLSDVGAATDSSWQRDRSGLNLNCRSIDVVVAAILLLLIATTVLNAAGRKRLGSEAFVLIAGAVTILGAATTMLIGQVTRAAVPQSNGARVLATGAVPCATRGGGGFAAGRLRDQTLSGASNLIGLVGAAFLVLLLSRCALHLGGRNLGRGLLDHRRWRHPFRRRRHIVILVRSFAEANV